MLGHIINTTLFRGNGNVELKVFTMEVSGRANGVSFSESDDWEKDEVIIRLIHSCRLVDGGIEEFVMRFTAQSYICQKAIASICIQYPSLVPQFYVTGYRNFGKQLVQEKEN